MGKLIHLLLIFVFVVVCGCSQLDQENGGEKGKTLEQGFVNPPDLARPWVYWFWINGNISKEGITADLEAMKKAGVGGVLWMGVGGPWWAPEGQIDPGTSKWQDAMQFAIKEAGRLGLEFDISVDYGYGSGGPHITPDKSMQQLVWSQTIINGGKKIDTTLNKPEISKSNIDQAWLRPGQKLSKKVLEDIRKIDSYRDIAVWAIPYSSGKDSFRIPQHDLRSGLGDKTYFLGLEKLTPPGDDVIPKDDIIDLTSRMNEDGILNWEAPEGEWQIVRMGHASNFKMTRPCPTGVVGLECDRLNTEGIDTHFKKHLKPVFEKAGSFAGNTLKYVHVDSWEAGYQNWTDEFAREFRKRRGYDPQPWLPVLKGQVVESPELSDRFLWDFRSTISELIMNNYAGRLRELASKYGIKFSTEAYGRLCIDNLSYAGTSDMPIAEFWTSEQGHFPDFGGGYYNSMKVMASAAHTHGKPRVGAEAFTGNRSWRDHPYHLKGMGDQAFSEGINHFILHLSAHQAYDRMKPGLTHRRWGHHFNRHNTWWDFSEPWFDYLTRSQFMLQQGKFVADVCYFFGEGAPLSAENGMSLDLPHGYDYDFISAEMLQKMKVRNGKIVLPSGMSYRYLLLPNTDRLTLSSAQKIKDLVEAGGRVVTQKRITGTPGLSGYPEADQKVKSIAERLWSRKNVITGSNWDKIFQDDGIKPDFEGKGLNFIHRKTGEADIYFVANPDPKVVETQCSFRIADKIPELWNPETGEIRPLPEYEVSGGQVSVPLRFDPMQSWFVVFRKKVSSETTNSQTSNAKNFFTYHPVKTINGPWKVKFDPEWGGPEQPVTFDTLQDWSTNSKKGIRYYSGMATYKKTFNLSSPQLSQSTPVFLDLGQVKIMARVSVNGKDCGYAWKPPYRVDISNALQSGKNELEVDVVNLWVNRMIGDERLYPEDGNWIKNKETLKNWPEWFLKEDISRPTGRYTFTSAKHYTEDGSIYYEKDDPLLPSGLLGPVRIYKQSD